MSFSVPMKGKTRDEILVLYKSACIEDMLMKDRDLARLAERARVKRVQRIYSEEKCEKVLMEIAESKEKLMDVELESQKLISEIKLQWDAHIAFLEEELRNKSIEIANLEKQAQELAEKEISYYQAVAEGELLEEWRQLKAEFNNLSSQSRALESQLIPKTAEYTETSTAPSNRIKIGGTKKRKPKIFK